RHQSRRQARLTGTIGAHRGKAPVEELPVDLVRQEHQRVLQVDDLIQARQQQVRLARVSWLGHLVPPNRDDRRWESNHALPKTGIPKHKKASRMARFLSQSNTHSARINSSNQPLRDSSRTTNQRNETGIDARKPYTVKITAKTRQRGSHEPWRTDLRLPIILARAAVIRRPPAAGV